MVHQTWSLSLLCLASCFASVLSQDMQVLKRVPIGRHLAVGDFAIVNEVFKSIEIPIDVADPIVIGTFAGDVTVDLNNLVCRNVDLGDVTLTYNQPATTSVNFTMNVIQFDIECSFDYAYSAPLGISGAASAGLFTNDNFFSADFLLSQSSSVAPPDAFSVSNCVPVIMIENIDFQGGIVASILDLIEPSLRGLIADKIKAFICDYMTNLEDLTLGLLGNVSAFVDPFLDAIDSVDPLAPENELNRTVKPGVTLINFQEPKGAISIAVDTLLNEATRILGAERSDPDSPTGTGQDLGINMLIRDFLLDKQRAFAVNTTAFGFLNNGTLVDSLVGNISDVEIRIERVRLQGLDTFTRFDPFQELGRYTMQGSFAWKYLILELDLYIALGPPGSDEKVEESITVSTRVDDLEFAFAALIAVNEASLEALQIGYVLQPEEVVPCFFSTAEALKISSLNLTIGSITDPIIQDFKSPGLARVLGSAIEGLYELFDGVVVAALPGMFQTTVKDLLNEQIAKIMDGSGCDKIKVAGDGSQFIDFRDLFYDPSKAKQLGGSGSKPYGEITKLLRDLIDDLLIADDPTTGMPKINEQLIVPLTHFLSGTNGVFKFNGTIVSFNGGFNFGEFGSDIAFEVRDVQLENIDSVSSPLVILEPTNKSGVELDNDVTFGFEDRPLRASARVLLAVQGEDLDIRDELVLSLNLVEARASLLLLVEMLVPRLMSLPLGSLINVHCWLATIPAPTLSPQGVRLTQVERTAGLIDAMVLFQKLFLNVTCIDCTSSGFYDLAERLGSKEGTQGTTDAANAIFEYGLSLLHGEFVQTFLDRAINEAPAKCPTNAAYDPDFKGLKFESFSEVDPPSDSISFLVTVVGITAGIVVVFVLISYAVRCYVMRRNTKWVNTLPAETVFRICAEQKREADKAVYLRDATSSMVTSTDVPAFVRYSMPFIILGNIGLFLSGHLSIGGAVSIYVQFAEEEIVIDNVFTFSIAESIIQLWDAGGKQLAILIALFSGVWPYTKQILTLIIWFLPPRRLSVGRRGALLIWLDILAKWSSADIFFLLVSLTAFNIHVQSPSVSFLPDEFYSVDLMLIPLWGLYANLIAQLLSQISSHIIIHYHRKVVQKALDRRDDKEHAVIYSAEDAHIISDSTRNESRSAAPAEKLREHGFLRPHRGDKDVLTVRRGVNVLLTGTAVVLTVLIIVGCSLPTFSFEQLGLLGIAVEVGRSVDVASNQFSVFGIAATLMNQGLFLGTGKAITGMLVVSSLMILTVFVVPLVQIGVLLYQWFWPMKQNKRGKLEVFVEILAAWQYIEVYLIAVMVSAWQLGPTSEYLINSYCEKLKGTFSSLVYYGIIKEEDAQCFKLSASIESGCFVLIAAAFLLAFLNIFVSKAVFQYQRDKLAEEKRLNEPANSDTTTEHFAETMKVEQAREKIHSTPVLFSDTFRWLLESSPEETTHDSEDLQVVEDIDSLQSIQKSTKGLAPIVVESESQTNSSALTHWPTVRTYSSGLQSVDGSESELASYGYATDENSTC